MGKKSFTILNYANGNNELEPEIYETFLKVKREVISDDIKVVTQLARAPQNLVKLLRHNLEYKHEDSWYGVRRYETINSGTRLIEDLGNRNMADPYTLYEFITWGITKYPAENIILILSGHGAGFAGIMTDLAGKHPNIMPISGLCSAIYKSKQKTKKNIDFILLDSCYMNMIEVWHELCFIPNNPIKHIIAPSKNIPLRGLSYQIIIKHLQDESNTHKKTLEILESSVKKYNQQDKDNELFVVKLEEKKFNKLKKSIDNLACDYINKERQLINKIRKQLKEPIVSVLCLEEILSKYISKYKIREALKDVISYDNASKYIKELENGPSIYLPSSIEQYQPVRKYYKQMTFLDKNRWINVVDNKYTTNYYEISQKHSNYEKMPLPIIIPIESIISVILEQNPNIELEEAHKLVNKLGWKI